MENCIADNIKDELLEGTGNRVSCHFARNIFIKV